ncbi:flagellar protein FlaG [Thalassospira sp. NFXS8]|uniref:flagellar protein FlaG n=1 Tax=Thalassospira sp. NFXS8 TaxID=2819093 RepID=UPI0032DFA4C7
MEITQSLSPLHGSVSSSSGSAAATGISAPGLSSVNSGTSSAPATVAPVSRYQASGDSAPIDATDQLKQAFADLDLTGRPIDNYRVELNFNRDTGRVVAKVTDRTNGEILREIPSKELQNLFSQIRDYLGTFVNEEA